MKRFVLIILVLLFTLPLFANTITSNTSGDWTLNTTWDNNTPVNGDTVVISSGTTVTISTPLTFNGVIQIYGILLFDNGKITMDDSSAIQIAPEGDITSVGGGNSDHITIGTGSNRFSWKGNEINNVQSPNELNNTGETLGDPLPITLLSFNASINNDNIVLKWVTASEENFDYFLIQKSIDGKDFFNIGEVKGSGNSFETLQYSFIDFVYKKDTNESNRYYYRLKNIDLDGSYDYSEILIVNNNKTEEILYTNGFINIYSSSNSLLNIINAQGDIIYTHPIIEGSNKICYNLDKGFHILKLGNHMVKKIVIR